MLAGEWHDCEAIVELLTQGRAIVRLEKPMVDSSCHGCAACSSGGAPAPIRLTVDVGSSPAQPGQRVRVRRFVMNPALAAGLVFGLPLAGLLTGLMACQALSAHAVLAGDLVSSMALGLAGLAGGGIAAWSAERAIRVSHPPTLLAASTDQVPKSVYFG